MAAAGMAGMAAATDGWDFSSREPCAPGVSTLRSVHPSHPSKLRCASDSRKASRYAASLDVDWTEATHSSGGTAAEAADAPSSVPQVPQ